MSKRKKTDPDPADEEENDEIDDSRNKTRQPETQKVYDFHKKTIEVYPDRLRELNRQFLASISTQVNNEPYSVLVGNCLDYVRQYFVYEDDLLKHSPWLATRLKQSRSDIVNCLQETIDVYEALARQDFDKLFEKQPTKSNNTNTDSFIPFANPSTTTTIRPFSSPSSTAKTLPKPTTTIDETPKDSFNFKIPTPGSPTKKVDSTPAAPFAFTLPNKGFGTSTFSSPSLTIPTNSELPKFSFNPTPTNIGTESTEDNEDEATEPPEPEKVEHETGAKLTFHCRMGVNKSGKLIKRGPVQVVLKEANDKHQLIIRSDDSLGRLFLNIIWSKMVELKKNSNKDLTFICKLNPSMPEIAEGEFVMILLRFDNETDRNDAFEKLDKERK